MDVGHMCATPKAEASFLEIEVEAEYWPVRGC